MRGRPGGGPGGNRNGPGNIMGGGMGGFCWGWEVGRGSVPGGANGCSPCDGSFTLK